MIVRYYACDNIRCPDRTEDKVVRYTVQNAYMIRCPKCKSTVTLDRTITIPDVIRRKK
jgi:hypothetical protein